MPPKTRSRHTKAKTKVVFFTKTSCVNEEVNPKCTVKLDNGYSPQLKQVSLDNRPQVTIDVTVHGEGSYMQSGLHLARVAAGYVLAGGGGLGWSTQRQKSGDVQQCNPPGINPWWA
jgi:hypothetical protein